MRSMSMRKRSGVSVAPDKGAHRPMSDGAAGKIHDRVRQEMRQVLAENTVVPFVDAERHSLAGASSAAIYDIGPCDSNAAPRRGISASLDMAGRLDEPCSGAAIGSARTQCDK